MKTKPLITISKPEYGAVAIKVAELEIAEVLGLLRIATIYVEKLIKEPSVEVERSNEETK